MEDEKDLCLIKLSATIKEIAENTNFAYPATTLYFTKQIKQELKIEG